jgi:hypothetical protein
MSVGKLQENKYIYNNSIIKSLNLNEDNYLLDQTHGLDTLLYIYKEGKKAKHTINNSIQIYRYSIIDDKLLLSINPDKLYKRYVFAHPNLPNDIQYTSYFKKLDTPLLIPNIDTNICGIQALLQILLRTKLFKNIFFENTSSDNRDLIYYTCLLLYLNVECDNRDESAKYIKKYIGENIITLMKTENEHKQQVYETMLSTIRGTTDVDYLDNLLIIYKIKGGTAYTMNSIPVDMVIQTKFITDKKYISEETKNKDIYLLKNTNYTLKDYPFQMDKNAKYTPLDGVNISDIKMNTNILQLLYSIITYGEDNEYFSQKDITHMISFIEHWPFLQKNCKLITAFDATCGNEIYTINHNDLLKKEKDHDLVAISYGEGVYINDIKNMVYKTQCNIEYKLEDSSDYYLLGFCHRDSNIPGAGHHKSYIFINDQLYNYDNMLTSHSIIDVGDHDKLLKEADLFIYEKKN